MKIDKVCVDKRKVTRKTRTSHNKQEIVLKNKKKTKQQQPGSGRNTFHVFGQHLCICPWTLIDDTVTDQYAL